jgi:hypothetical protein
MRELQVIAKPAVGQQAWCGYDTFLYDRCFVGFMRSIYLFVLLSKDLDPFSNTFRGSCSTLVDWCAGRGFLDALR